jgi:hypothetical protein
MVQKPTSLLRNIIVAMLACTAAQGQNAPATILQVDIENWVVFVVAVYGCSDSVNR